MVMDTARRVREGLAELIRLANDPATPTSDLQALLAECKTFGGQLAVLQTDAAAGLALRERHGDGGVGVLAQSAGLSKRDAASQVKTVEKLQEMPAARDAVETGRISVANAKTLARASGKTSAAQVDGDAELLEKAAQLSPDQFVREASRWTIKRQDDGGEGEYQHQRARRRLSFWDGDDGMVHLRGELDPVTGAKVRKRFVQEAERLRRLDLHSPGGEKRSLDQRMADALDTLTSHGSIYTRAASAGNNINDANNGSAVGGANEISDVGNADGANSVGNEFGNAGTVGGANGVGNARNADGANSVGNGFGNAGTVGGANGVGNARKAGNGAGGGCGCGRVSADITIVQHLSADGTDAFAEVAGGGVIPPSVLEEHFCNARIKGVVFSSEGMPLWHGHAKRRATKAQMNALRALYGACGGCGADMWICDGHHREPVSQGGRTDIDNMMLLCWVCHQKVHHHGWREVPDGRGLYTIAPPERIRHGPAHAPDPPPVHGSPHQRPRRAARPASTAMAQDDAQVGTPNGEGTRRPAEPEPLFTVA